MIDQTDLNWRPSACQAHVELLSEKNFNQEIGALMDNFYDFMVVDLRRTKRTAKAKVWYIRKFLQATEKNPLQMTRDEISNYLKTLNCVETATYSNTLKSLEVFFRVYLQKPEVVASFARAYPKI